MRSDVERRTSRRSSLAVAVGVLALSAVVLYEPARAQTQFGVVGRWTTLSTMMPINPVHVALLRNGKVLVVSGSGNVATETNFRAAIWDPQSGTIAVRSLGWDMFCNGMVTLPDGRVLINGGNLQYDPFHGQPRNAVYDPATDLFMDIQNMAHGRWYPTTTLLGDGRVMTFSGLDEFGATNKAVEFYTLELWLEFGIDRRVDTPLYPRMHLLPDGRVLYSGSGTGSRFFTPSNGTWSTDSHHQVRWHAHLRHFGAPAVDAIRRVHGSSHDSRRRQSRNQHDGDPRPVGDAAGNGSSARRCRNHASK